ncbi:hypothetical protein GCM10028805_12580 [Spirosoma harenae]
MIRHTNELKQQIERILRWEQSSHWRLRDFAHLSEQIVAHTQQRLDAQALQEFWRFSIVPSPTFLDILARFADYADWDDFCTRNFYGRIKVDEETEMLHAPMWEIPVRWVIAICWFSILTSVVIAILLVWKR